VLSGTDFIDGASVLWDGSVLSTTFVSSTKMMAQIATVHLATAELAAVQVSNPGLAEAPSNSLIFIVGYPLPVISSLTPDTVPLGSPGMLLTVQGMDFAAGAQVMWNGEVLPTTFLNSTQLTAQVAAKLAAGRTVGVNVLNPTPGGGFSNVVDFVVRRRIQGFLFLPVFMR
jgi:hypothetical protein